MSILFVLVPIALTLALAALLAFLWSVGSGQLDDVVTPARRMLHDDTPRVGALNRKPPNDS